MSAPTIFSRRKFFQQTGALSALTLAGHLDMLGLSSAAAQTGPYKALVCLFAFGGNDSNSTLLPYSDYASYNAVRPVSTGVNVAQSLLTPVSPLNTPGVTYALHPAFTATNGNPTLSSLFSTGKLAILANAGSLVEPMTRAEYLNGSKKRPDQLFSHSDQQQQGQTSIAQASILTGPTGWGGRLADRINSLNSPTATPMSMSFSGAQTFLSGRTIRGLALPTAGNFGFSGDPTGAPTAAQAARSAARAEMILASDANEVVAAAQQSMGGALSASQRINPIINGTLPTAIQAPFNGLNSGLANQLRTVARMIAQRATLGHSRQIFFVSIGGFDTHTGQGAAQPPLVFQGLNSLYQQIGYAMSAFYQATVNLGVVNDVTTFTLTDFNRTFKPNGVGTDHAWGGHHLIMGGSVIGQRLYGAFPSLALAGPADSGSIGRWIPTTSIDQYGATLARWFGVPDVDLVQVFPNINRFATSNLGFMA